MTILTVFGAANQQKWLKSKNPFWNLFKVPIVIENEGSHQDLKIVPFFHLIPPTPRYIHNTFSKCLKHEKQFLFILIYFCWTLLYLRPPTLINTWTFVGPWQTIWNPLSALISHWKLWNEVFLVITGCGKKKWNIRFFGVICRGGCLWLFSGS